MGDPDRTPPAAVRQGEILELAEPEYMYGIGPIKLRATAPIPFPHHNTDWMRIVAVQVFWDGSEKPRDVLVRAAALLRHAMQHHRQAPPRP